MGNIFEICNSVCIYGRSVEPVKASDQYIVINDMDDTNKKAMKVWTEDGIDSVLKHMLTDDDGKPRDYSQMRMMYG
jgi:hypothetical protein